ncbi:bifunctional DNA primase/polymerase [Lentzea flaviverrucosa]|uniref:Bifunctional DNA primase/polymerase, N-terminal n=1 Tax=Lentzea flaviverrucosa TaxID=200379 RepID=A0A1H9XKF3_9PSEU|nr:bifunctional DNA primase/polymerase [Lentzea flaviverrucosa]RDI20325.1 bifunctional DNA primase/polymerase-like protein [Lentzea flaviverrucosa]SES46594.1 Bifunctional DNA primase/polymerase, N-terminal [Lentzea flaviverrucosa]
MTTNRTVQTAADVALWLAVHRGWHVLPLNYGTKRPLGGCVDCRAEHTDHTPQTCPCLARAEGALCHGVWAATTDPGVIARWAQRWHTSVWAVHLGVSGLLAVDLDTRPGPPPRQPLNGLAWPADEPPPADGLDTYATLAALSGGTVGTDTFTTDTPSGGLHLVYGTEPLRWKGSHGKPRPGDDTVRTGLGWQIDIKAYGGYVVLPGSTSDAGQYRRSSTTTTPRRLDPWLVEALARTGHDRTATPAPPATAAPVPAFVHGDSRQARFAAGALRSACAELAAMEPDTGRNRKLFRSTTRLAGMAQAGWIDRDVVQAALADAARHAGLPAAEIRYVLASGFGRPLPVPDIRSAA